MVRPVRTTALLGIIAAGTLGLTFLQTWLVVVTLGPGQATDAFFASVAVPQFLMNAVVGSVPFVLVPLLAARPVADGLPPVASLAGFIVLLTTALAASIGVTANGWMPLVAPGLTPEAQRLAAGLCPVLLIGFPVAAFGSVMVSHAYAQNKIIFAESSSLIANAVAFGSLLVMLPRWGIASAAWATVIRSAIQVAVLLPLMRGSKLLAWDTRLMAPFLRRLKPLLFGAAVYKSDVIVDRLLSSLGPPGGLSLFNVAQQLHFAVAAVAGKAIAAPLLPKLSTVAGRSQWSEFAKLVRQSAVWLSVACLLAFVLLALGGKAGLSLIFDYGRFSTGNVQALWALVLPLFGVTVGGILGNLLSTGFYAMGDTRSPTLIGIVGFGIGVALKIVGLWFGGLAGLAIATSAYYALNALFLGVMLGARVAVHMRG